MKENVGRVDRALRVTIGVLLIVLSASGVIGLWGLIGILPIATALFKFCPLYSMRGISTCPVEKQLHFGEKQD